jgi:hypothetical protein
MEYVVGEAIEDLSDVRIKQVASTRNTWLLFADQSLAVTQEARSESPSSIKRNNQFYQRFIAKLPPLSQDERVVEGCSYRSILLSPPIKFF